MAADPRRKPRSGLHRQPHLRLCRSRRRHRDHGHRQALLGEGVEQAFRIRLKYGKGRERTISGIKRISTPGRRVYAQRDKLPRVLGGLGIAIVSTSQGVMTDRDASKKGIGGEVLAFVW